MMIQFLERITRLIILWITLVSGFIVYYNTIYNVDTNSIFKYGPNNMLVIIYIPINTPIKYTVVVLFCMFNSIVRSCNQNILHPWITNEIQDLNNHNKINRRFCYEISVVSCLYNWFDFFMYMNILMSQIDLFLVEVLSDVLVSIFITNYYLKHKDDDSYVLLTS